VVDARDQELDLVIGSDRGSASFLRSLVSHCTVVILVITRYGEVEECMEIRRDGSEEEVVMLKFRSRDLVGIEV
jgi:hypothetical protein